MIDTHCHLDVARFEPDRDQVLSRAWAAGVQGLVIPAIGPSAWAALREWPGRDPRVQVALGIHPQLLPQLDPADDQRHLAQLDAALALGGAVAVGECGLDGPSEARAPMERQLRVFLAHLELARKHRLPLLVHCLRAHPHLQHALTQVGPLEVGVLLHSYSGSHELVRTYTKLGCHFSFAGPVTFAEARRPLEAVRAVPLHLLMAETDAPDQAPQPYRGARCEPSMLPFIIDAMAGTRGITADALREQVSRNARAFFACRFGEPLRVGAALPTALTRRV